MEAYLTDIGNIRADYKIDSKGRLTYPFAKADQGKVYIMIKAAPEPEERCLTCMSEAQFAAYYAKLRKVGTADAAYKIVRQILASVDTVVIDSTGKILINKALRGYAGITERTILMDTPDGTEIWSAERFEAKRERDLSDEAAFKAFESHMIENRADQNDIESLRKQIEYVKLQGELREARNRLERLNTGAGQNE